MPFARQIQSSILALMLRGDAITGFADNAASAPVEDLYLSLHTADPTDLGSQDTSEAAYTGYARVAIERSAIGALRFEVAAGVASFSAGIDFPQCSAGTATITHVGVGTASAGPGSAILFGELETPFEIEAGDIPRLTADSTFTLR